MDVEGGKRSNLRIVLHTENPIQKKKNDTKWSTDFGRGGGHTYTKLLIQRTREKMRNHKSGARVFCFFAK